MFAASNLHIKQEATTLSQLITYFQEKDIQLIKIIDFEYFLLYFKNQPENGRCLRSRLE